MNDTNFDLDIRIDVRVLPRQCPYDTLEKIQWNGIENRMNWDARILADALKKYFEAKVMDEIKYLPKK